MALVEYDGLFPSVQSDRYGYIYDKCFVRRKTRYPEYLRPYGEVSQGSSYLAAAN